MKNTPTVLAALLAICCMPSATAWAEEANLSPNTNGGTGNMPSGYSQLNFLLSNGDWVTDIRLPTAATHGDRVAAMSDAHWIARFDLTGTVFESAAGAPFVKDVLLDFVWNTYAGRWDVQDGPMARALLGPNLAVDHIAPSPHLLTQYTMIDGMHAKELHLPVQAQEHAILAVANRATWSTRINAAPGTLKGDWHECGSLQDCTFLYDTGTKRWRAATGTSTIGPQAQLPFPSRTVMRVVAKPALDPATRITLPAWAVHGDVYAIVDNSGAVGHHVETANTNLPAPVSLEDGRELRLRYNAIVYTWEQVQ